MVQVDNEMYSNVSYSILINGNPVGHIHPKRGTRQGDPISPYIYLLCTEGFVQSFFEHHEIKIKSYTYMPHPKNRISNLSQRL